jgi:hypothetical protein
VLLDLPRLGNQPAYVLNELVFSVIAVAFQNYYPLNAKNALKLFKIGLGCVNQVPIELHEL